MHSYASLSLLFNWGDELKSNTELYSQAVTLEGVSPQSRLITLTGNVQAFGVLFRAAGAFPFFGIPMEELTSIDSLRTFRLPELHEQLSKISTLQGKGKHIESWLLRLLANGQTHSTFNPTSLMRIDNHFGHPSVQDIADNIGLSERQLERLFKNNVGLSPKKYLSLIRLHNARSALKQANSCTLTDIAHMIGFYDQAHFNREFKNAIGITPGEYVSRQNRLEN